MKVKIGNKWYDSDDQYVAVQFEPNELEMVKSMNVETSPNLKFGAGVQSDVDLKKWIRDEVEI